MNNPNKYLSLIEWYWQQPDSDWTITIKVGEFKTMFEAALFAVRQKRLKFDTQSDTYKLVNHQGIDHEVPRNSVLIRKYTLESRNKVVLENSDFIEIDNPQQELHLIQLFESGLSSSLCGVQDLSDNQYYLLFELSPDESNLEDFKTYIEGITSN